MKKIAMALAVSGALFAGELAEACTATGVYDRATRVEDTEIYDTVRDVIETDTVIQQEDWQREDATHAAVGTVLREAYIKDRGAVVGTHNEYETYENHLNSTRKVQQMLDEPCGYKYDRHTHLRTVRDHVIMHGNDWEDGTNGARTPWTQPRGANPAPTAPPPPPIDHAG